MFNLFLAGHVYGQQKQFSQAQYALEQALAIAEKFDNPSLINQMNAHLGKVTIAQEEYATARTHLRQALAVQWNAGYVYLMSYTLLYIAQMFANQNDEERAVMILATIDQYLTYYDATDLTALQLTDELKTHLGSQRFTIAWEQGQDRKLNELVVELLDELTKD